MYQGILPGHKRRSTEPNGHVRMNDNNSIGLYYGPCTRYQVLVSEVLSEVLSLSIRIDLTFLFNLKYIVIKQKAA